MSKPLENIKIVTLALNLPGPLAAKRFADLGASVIKVEPPQGDPFKLYCPEWAQQINAGQQVQCIDLKTEKGQEALSLLLETADLLLTAQRPAAMDRLGLGWDVLHAKFPSLNHLAIVGYPAPNQEHAGHDLTYQASLGLLTDGHMPKTLVADLVGAEQAAFEGLAMLMATKAGHTGQKKLIALSTAADYMAQPIKYGLTGEGAMLGGRLPEYSLYKTATEWVAIAAIEPHFKANLMKQLKLDNLTHETLAEKLKQQPATAWVDWANQLDIPLVAVKQL
jgi:alpha-methylacyl-CoA racemase